MRFLYMVYDSKWYGYVVSIYILDHHYTCLKTIDDHIIAEISIY